MSIILNKQELLEENTKLRGPALEILEAGLEAIDTEKILRKKVSIVDGVLKIAEFGSELDLKSYERIFFVGIGKCALDGAKVIEDILGDCLTQGMVIDVKDESEATTLKKTKYFKGTHPYPSEQNVEATKEILKMVENVTEKDLIITLISGGGSALFELPIEGISLDEIIKTTKELTTKGADIYELNKVRKGLSQVKGGKFAEICSPAHMVSLIFSDVLGNDISMIASGPTVLPSPSQGEGQFAEGKRGGVVNILLVSNKDALEAMKIKAIDLGFDTNIETEKLSGNAELIGEQLALREPVLGKCILFGGETTVKIKGDGIGGRNQEMALSAVHNIFPNSVLICVASDGWDNSDYAGAIADVEIFNKGRDLGIYPDDYLARNDSYNFFKKVSGGIYTGRLGSNVSDLCILIYK